MANVLDFLGYLIPGARSVQYGQDSQAKAFRGLRDGTLSIAEFKLVAAIQGILFTTNVGSLVTPIGGHIALTQLQPEFNLDVPAGIVAIMLPPNVYLETSAGTLTRVLAASRAANLMGLGTSAVPTVGPFSSRSDRVVASACVARQAYSAPGNSLATGEVQLEHWRAGYPFADATGAPIKQFAPSQDNWPWPILVGPSSFQLYWGATTTAPTGWAQVSWIELPASFLN